MVCPIRAKRLVLLLGCGPPLRTSHTPSPGVMTWLQSGPAKPLEQIQLPKVCWFKYGYNHLDFSVMSINRIWKRISAPTRALPCSRESMRPWANASRREICKGSGTISTRPPVNLFPTCLKSSRGRRNARPAALIMRTSSQTKKKRAITRTNVSSGKKANKNLFLSKWGTSRYRHWGNILSKLANSVTCKSVLSSEKLKKSENDPFYFSNRTSTVCRLLWNFDCWFLQGKDNQRIWEVGRHETLATPHIRLAMKNKHRISRYCVNLRRVLIIASCNFPQ